MSFLGVDYGLAKIGLAISEGNLATPLPVLRIKNPGQARQRILQLIDEHQVKTVVFGIPHPDSIGAEKFADELEEIVKIELVKVDETLTTKIAGQTSKKKNEDSAVAANLLQEYLDQEKRNNVAI
ncbi:MAG: RuvX/YqgF family protein [bacterium]|nr:RuvX/YqgF family protein [bacterium]